MAKDSMAYPYLTLSCLCEQKNFDLEKVCKLNRIGAFYCMTFRATDPETSECRLFRGVVECLTRDVFLCKIKEPDGIAILNDSVENYVEALSESKEDHSLAHGSTPFSTHNLTTIRPTSNLYKNLSEIGKEGLGRTVLIPRPNQSIIKGSVEPDPRDPMNQYSLQNLRELCDEYYDGRDCPSPGWVTMTEFNADQTKDLRNAAAKLALNIYNQKEQNNFNLEKVCKLNFIVSYFFMTFTAKNAVTDECRVFRGVVHALSDAVYLCEVKETNDIGIPSDGVENHSPRTWDPKSLLYIY